MKVLEYCERVVRIVWHSVPAYNLVSDRVWAEDTQAALQAVVLAKEGKHTAALRLAVPVAERWGAV